MSSSRPRPRRAGRRTTDAMQHRPHATIAALLMGAAFSFAACDRAEQASPAPAPEPAAAPTPTPTPAPVSAPEAETRRGVVPQPREIPAPAPADATAARAKYDFSELYGTCERGEGGSGRTYMGREISEVMGHFGVGWLERPEREREERTDLLVNALKLKPTDAVADIGAGSGYFTMRMAPMVPEGVVYATDIQQEMLDIVVERALEEEAWNVMPVLGEIDHCGLEPGSIDVALFVDAYHEFSHPREMMESLLDALKPGGRVILVEYRLEDPSVPIKERHKMSEAQAKLEMAAVGDAARGGFEFVENISVLPQQHLMVFRRR
jgi:ubiquinone/menaquinone biosynthesis C-methylase UbiE